MNRLASTRCKGRNLYEIGDVPQKKLAFRMANCNDVAKRTQGISERERGREKLAWVGTPATLKGFMQRHLFFQVHEAQYEYAWPR